MNDSELSAAIAEAVRPIALAFTVRGGPMRAAISWFEERGSWVYGWNDPATINQTFNTIPPRWAAAILMHELHKIAWPVAGQLQNERETQAMHAYAKLKELLRAQA